MESRITFPADLIGRFTFPTILAFGTDDSQSRYVLTFHLHAATGVEADGLIIGSHDTSLILLNVGFHDSPVIAMAEGQFVVSLTETESCREAATRRIVPALLSSTLAEAGKHRF